MTGFIAKNLSLVVGENWFVVSEQAGNFVRTNEWRLCFLDRNSCQLHS